jgi:GTP-binding protein HflX
LNQAKPKNSKPSSAGRQSGIDRSPAPTRALVIHPIIEANGRDPELRLAEARGLAEALDMDVAGAELIRLKAPQPGTLLGGGRVEALREAVETEDASVVVVDAAVTPVQQRNLEKALNAKVLDRTGLILEIFGRRAQTREGRLQVELARLGYEKSRLVRTWTHLERQRGGLGKMGGPGETQIESDRRLISNRILKLERELEDVRRTRGLQRHARKRAGIPTVVLVGYTNAGKSSLFNALTRAGVFAKDMPFATLDPTARKVRLPSGRYVVIADTVGFISDLPTELVAAFRATLEAVTQADVLLHVRDIAHPETDEQRKDVEGVLDRLAKDADSEEGPTLEVWNKIDLLDADRRSARARRAQDVGAAMVSATEAEGLTELLEAIDRLAYGHAQVVDLTLDLADGGARAWIASRGKIIEEHVEDGTLHVRAELPAPDALQAIERYASAS